MVRSKLFLGMLICTVAVLLISCGNNSDMSSSSDKRQTETSSISEENDQSHQSEIKDKKADESTPSEDDAGKITDNKNSVKSNKSDKKQESTVKADERSQKGSENLKYYYINKLDNVEAGMSDLDAQYAGTTADMRMAADEEYKRWDNALNEIYSVLKTQLSENEMKDLSKEEVQWIEYKEEKAQKEASQYEGGTIEPVVYMTSLSQTTKERCYELVNKYMN